MWERIKLKIAQWMYGRNGADELGLFCLILALVLNLINNFIGFALLNTLFMIITMFLYVWTVFRIFSRDLEKRSAENEKYRELTGRTKKESRQFFVRVKNSKEYKYFRCPGCKARMRLKRGSGERHIVCPKCRREFDQKA